MLTGNLPSDGGNLIFSNSEYLAIVKSDISAQKFFKRFVGSREIINGGDRWCAWIDGSNVEQASRIDELHRRFLDVEKVRKSSRGEQAKGGIETPYRFVFAPHRDGYAIAIPKVSSSRRDYIPCALTDGDTVVSNLASVMYDTPPWTLSIIASRLHTTWISTVCGRLKTDFRYSNTLGWNTFPVPKLTEQNKSDLTRCAEDILLARETHFPKTIAELYDPDEMPADLREAHERNDEVLERIYIGRRFRNDTERLEKLFDLYTKMTAAEGAGKGSARARTKKAKPNENERGLV